MTILSSLDDRCWRHDEVYVWFGSGYRITLLSCEERATCTDRREAEPCALLVSLERAGDAWEDGLGALLVPLFDLQDR